MTVFSDSVDPEEVRKPQTVKHIKSILKTSLGLGAFTAVFYLIFFLYVGIHATPLTQATLFLFYNFTQLLVIISVRSKRNFFWRGTKPSHMLLCAIAMFIIVSAALVYVPFTAGVMGFAPLPFHDIAILSCVAVTFIFLLDFVKVAMCKFFEKA